MSDWRTALIGKYVIHKPSGTYGKVKLVHEPNEFPTIHEGVPQCFKAPDTHVIEFEGRGDERGNCFLANDNESFVTLSQAEVDLLGATMLMTIDLIKETIHYGKANGVSLEGVVDILSYVLRTQGVLIKA